MPQVVVRTSNVGLPNPTEQTRIQVILPDYVFEEAIESLVMDWNAGAVPWAITAFPILPDSPAWFYFPEIQNYFQFQVRGYEWGGCSTACGPGTKSRMPVECFMPLLNRTVKLMECDTYLAIRPPGLEANNYTESASCQTAECESLKPWMIGVIIGAGIVFLMFILLIVRKLTRDVAKKDSLGDLQMTQFDRPSQQAGSSPTHHAGSAAQHSLNAGLNAMHAANAFSNYRPAASPNPVHSDDRAPGFSGYAAPNAAAPRGPPASGYGSPQAHSQHWSSPSSKMMAVSAFHNYHNEGFGVRNDHHSPVSRRDQLKDLL